MINEHQFHMGCKARKDGLDSSANPFSLGEFSDAWRDGFYYVPKKRKESIVNKIAKLDKMQQDVVKLQSEIISELMRK